MMQPIIIRLPDEDRRLLQLEAQSEGVPVSKVARKAIKTYLAILSPKDSNRVKALSIARSIFPSKEGLFTSYAVIGEVLTVGSARHNRQAAIDFVN